MKLDQEDLLVLMVVLWVVLFSAGLVVLIGLAEGWRS